MEKAGMNRRRLLFVANQPLTLRALAVPNPRGNRMNLAQTYFFASRTAPRGGGGKFLFKRSLWAEYGLPSAPKVAPLGADEAPFVGKRGSLPCRWAPFFGKGLPFLLIEPFFCKLRSLLCGRGRFFSKGSLFPQSPIPHTIQQTKICTQCAAIG